MRRENKTSNAQAFFTYGLVFAMGSGLSFASAGVVLAYAMTEAKAYGRDVASTAFQVATDIGIGGVGLATGVVLVTAITATFHYCKKNKEAQDDDATSLINTTLNSN